MLIFIFLCTFIGCETPSDIQELPQECSEMTRSQCMNSSSCTLELTDVNSIYLCRDASGICEEGVIQNDIVGNIEGNINCQELEGCEITSGECYCPCYGYGQTAVEDEEGLEDCSCMCGGEEPPSCIETE